MRVLAACSLGGMGHLRPLVPFLDVAVRRGHDVVVVAPPSMADAVEHSGHRFWPGGDVREEKIAPIREQLPVAPRRQAAVLANRELFGRLATAAMMPSMQRAFAAWQPDFVLREPCEYSSAVMAYRAGVAGAQVAVSLAGAEVGAIGLAAPVLEPLSTGVTGWLRALPYLSRFPASFDPSPFVTTIRYHDVRAPRSPSLPPWWEGLADAPLVYVSFGTVLGYMSIARSVYRCVLEALRQVRARVLLTVGDHFDTTQLGEVASNVHVEEWVDQADVLPVADLVVCHGGSGTVLGALSAGVPLVIVPSFADQLINGRRVAEAGAGVLVVAGGEDNDDGTADGGHYAVTGADALRIAEAVRVVLAGPSYRRGAQAVAAELAAYPSVEQAFAGLEIAR